MYVGWISAGWQRHCKSCRSLREPDNQGIVFCCRFVWRVGHNWRSSKTTCVVSRTFTPYKGNHRITVVFSGKTLTRQLHNTPTTISEKKSTLLKLSSIHKSASQAAMRRMQFALHATRQPPRGASRLVQAMSAWSVKIRHVPPWHCKDAKIYGHTTTAMHDIEYPPPQGEEKNGRM